MFNAAGENYAKARPRGVKRKRHRLLSDVFSSCNIITLLLSFVVTVDGQRYRVSICNLRLDVIRKKNDSVLHLLKNIPFKCFHLFLSHYYFCLEYDYLLSQYCRHSVRQYFKHLFSLHNLIALSALRCIFHTVDSEYPSSYAIPSMRFISM